MSRNELLGELCMVSSDSGKQCGIPLTDFFPFMKKIAFIFNLFWNSKLEKLNRETEITTLPFQEHCHKDPSQTINFDSSCL